ncbi:MAG: hypothetical protein ACE5GX_07640 [Thermoanaerobaculia bacterium]
MNSRVRAALIVAGVTATLAASAASAGTLHWRELDVRALLGEEGRLHVSERHEMVFSGGGGGGSW